MMIGIPMIQLTLFGYAINTDPKHLPTAVLLADDGASRPDLRGGDGEHGLLGVFGVADSRPRSTAPGGDALFAVNIPQVLARLDARRPPASF